MLQRTFLIAMLLCTPLLPATAQDEPDYAMEIGAGVGAAFGLNDTNSKILGQPGVKADFTLRYVINQRQALKMTLGYATTKGNTDNVGNFAPAVVGTSGTDRLKYNFSGGIIDLCALYELHFLPYGYNSGYQNLKRLVPYIQMGVGVAYGTAGKSVTPVVPLGIGLKYKLAQRWNLGFDWRMNFTISDKLDGLDSPRGIRSSGFKNKDHYSTAMLTLTYSFSERCPTCNKDDW